jgi:hypothetical protein
MCWRTGQIDDADLVKRNQLRHHRACLLLRPASRREQAWSADSRGTSVNPSTYARPSLRCLSLRAV